MEEILTGGNMNTVVRVQDTVRRTPGPWTVTIHALLAHVRGRGVPWVPRAHGLDEQGREILDFLPGDVPAYPLPSWVWSADFLESSTRAMRQFHDATVDFAVPAPSWQLPSHGAPEVICHNDFAPYNIVCRNGRFAGLIDFDTASPGSRLWDLAYLAYRLVPLVAPGNTDTAPPAVLAGRGRRIGLLLDAYGGGYTPEELVRTAVDRLYELADFSDARAVTHDQPKLAGHAVLYRRDAEHLRSLPG